MAAPLRVPLQQRPCHAVAQQQRSFSSQIVLAPHPASRHAAAAPSSAFCPFTAAAASLRRPSRMAMRSTSMDEIKGLTRDYCDDFVCSSSPSVEQGVRSFAKDLERMRYTKSLFSKDATFSDDSFRSFKGADGFVRQTWILDSVQKPKVTVEKMQMLEQDKAQLNWRLTGTVGAAPCDISFTSVIELHLITGRITSVKESWDLSRMAPPASIIVKSNRAAWSAKQASIDAREGLNRLSDSIASSMSMDDDGGEIYRDPTDPTKFFQQGQDQQLQDMINFALVVVALYAVFIGFKTVITV